MTLHVHHLYGCAPAPLAFYLKALGILRIVAEQKDAAVRGWWQDEHFCLLTTLDRGGLEKFFLEDYAPTPVFNPWGARSGFYPGSSERTARAALEKIESSKAPRLADFRATIGAVRTSIKEIGGVKPDSEDEKAILLDAIRRTVRGASSEWLGTVVAIVGEEYRQPALTGTGGNEGSGSYTSAYLNAVVDCLVERVADDALGLFSASPGASRTATPRWKGTFGQFLPEGVESAWDFLLVIEGTLVLQSAVTLRSMISAGRRFLASPFYFPPHAAGSGSSAPHDEYSVQKGRPNPGRGEQWFPLWTAPAGLLDLAAMFREGRCSIGRRHASSPVDALRAIRRLGVARGITMFCRYGYLQRNNIATHFAIPLGRIPVRQHPRGRLADDLAAWLGWLRRLARKPNAPARLVHLERRLADAVFAVLTHDDSPDRWQAVLLACSAVEAVQASGTALEAGPVPPLSPEWLAAADDGSAEWRLACALGGAAGSYDRTGRPCDPVRHHVLPLQVDARRFRMSERALAKDPRVVMSGRDPVADCLALVERRLVEAVGRAERKLPLVAAPGWDAHPSDLAELIAGRIDLDRVIGLARALMAIRWDRLQKGDDAHRRRGHAWPDEAWMALRLACLPWPLEENRRIPVESAMVRRLTAGDGAAAVDIALHRLRSAGLRPPLGGACTNPETARLWGTALAFPISPWSARAMAERFEPTNQEEVR
jgi:CRISPR-associated protein Csx17